MSAQGYGQDSNKITNNVFLCDAGNKLSDATTGESAQAPTPTVTPIFRSEVVDLNNVLKDDLTPVSVQGDRIRRWVDLSGNNNHAEQTDTGKQLQYEVDFAAFNTTKTPLGVGAVHSLNGGGQTALIVPFSLAPPFTIIYVGRSNSTSNTRILGLGAASQTEIITVNGVSMRMLARGSDTYDWTQNDADGDANDVGVNSILFDVPSTTNGFKAYRNGNLKTQQNTTSFSVTAGNIHIGSNTDANTSGNGIFEEVWIFDSILSDADRQLIENYLGDKYDFSPSKIKDIRNPTLTGDLLNGATHNDTIILDGVDDHVFFDTTAFNFEYNQPFSIEVIIKPDTGNGVIVSNQLDTAADNRGWELIWLSATNNGRINIRNSDGSTILIKVDTPTSSLPTATDSHWIMTYDGSNLASGVTNYINGQLVANTVVNDTLGANTIVDAAQRLYIGARAGFETPYDGEVEVVEIYDIELTATEIFDKWKAIRNRLS